MAEPSFKDGKIEILQGLHDHRKDRGIMGIPNDAIAFTSLRVDGKVKVLADVTVLNKDTGEYDLMVDVTHDAEPMEIWKSKLHRDVVIKPKELPLHKCVRYPNDYEKIGEL